MKSKLLLIIMLAVAVFAVSCKKDNPTPKDEPKTEFTVNLPSNGPLSVYRWSQTDQIRVGEGVFKIKEGAGTATAVFSGVPAKDNFYTIAYPADIKGTDTFLSYSLEGQTQAGNGSVDHLVCTALIEDAASCEEITLSKEWATTNKGTFRSNGVVAMTLTLPSTATTVTGITLEAADVEFPLNNSGDRKDGKLSLALTGLTVDGSPVKAFLAVGEKEVSIPANTLKITVIGEQSYYLTLAQDVKMGGGILTEITVSDASAWTAFSPLNGQGTEAAPYILNAPEHLEKMFELMEEGKTTWFELGADIDMKGVLSWNPLNIIAPYSNAINFDGKGHTISNFACESGVYPSFFGVLNGTVKNVTFDGAKIEGSGKTGVIAGYLGTNIGTTEAPEYVSATLTGVTVQNSEVIADSYAGGIAGQVYSPSVIKDCHVKNTKVTSTGERVGGLIGQLGVTNFAVNATMEDCTAEDVTLEASKNVGGVVGVSYNDISRCTASGHVTHNVESTKEVSLGGLVGHLEKANATDCSASTVIELTINGRSIGGFVGTFKGGKIERCFSTGNVIGKYRNNGGFVGLVQASAVTATIENCYSTGDVSSNSYMGGFAGLIDGQPEAVTITNCYCSGKVIADSFGAGGFIGFQSSKAFKAEGCVAWGSELTAGSIGEANWSSAAFSAVTYPLSTITNCYRNPAMAITAYWVPAAGYSHPDVSPTSPLIKQDGTPSKATAAANGQDGYPHFPYHGKVEAGKTLSQLASTLGWDTNVWDLSGDMPVFKK